jgi:hypothetical protein
MLPASVEDINRYDVDAGMLGEELLRDRRRKRRSHASDLLQGVREGTWIVMHVAFDKKYDVSGCHSFVAASPLYHHRNSLHHTLIVVQDE